MLSIKITKLTILRKSYDAICEAKADVVITYGDWTWPKTIKILVDLADLPPHEAYEDLRDC